MRDADEDAFSMVSTAPDIATLYTPPETERDTDEAGLFTPADSDTEDDDRWETTSNCSTSVAPSVYEYERAFGRQYHSYKKGRYPMPNDELERQREETKHTMMLELMDRQLFYSDIGEYPQKIIDIGTGIGSWVVDVADLYPSASVMGTDLSPIQPTWVPVNARMFVEDCEDPEWLHGSGFDLVHYREMAGMVRDLDGLLSKVYPHIKNGGWVEFHEIIPQILCDDGSMSSDDPLRMFTEITQQGFRKFGYTPVRLGDLESALDRAGFTNIRCITKKIPISSWARDKHLKTIGIFMKSTIQESLQALAAKPLAALDIPLEARKTLVDLVSKSLDNNRIHRYVNCCFCYGQKKEQTLSGSNYYM